MNRIESPEINLSLYGQLIFDKVGSSINGAKIAFSKNSVGRAGQIYAKNETQAPTYTIHKNKFKVDKRFKYKSYHHQTPGGEHRQENLTYSTQQYFH